MHNLKALLRKVTSESERSAVLFDLQKACRKWYCELVLPKMTHTTNVTVLLAAKTAEASKILDLIKLLFPFS